MKIWLRLLLSSTLFVSQFVYGETVDEAIERAKKDGSAEQARQSNCEIMKNKHHFNGECLTDEDLRHISGPLIAPGIYAPEVEAKMIDAIKNNDQATLETVQFINQMSIAAQSGQITDNLVNQRLNRLIIELIHSGVSQKIIETQLQTAFQIQNQLIRDQELNSKRIEIMNQFLHSINNKNRSFSLASFYIAFFQFSNSGYLQFQTQYGQIEFYLHK